MQLKSLGKMKFSVFEAFKYINVLIKKVKYRVINLLKIIEYTRWDYLDIVLYTFICCYHYAICVSHEWDSPIYDWSNFLEEFVYILQAVL